MRNILSLFFGFAVALASSGCLSLSKLLEKPTVVLQELTLQDPTLEGATLLFALQVENPNRVALEVDSLDYKIEVAERTLVSGTLHRKVRVAAFDQALIEIPVPFKYGDLLASVSQLFEKPITPYRIQGVAKLGPISIPFEKTGEIRVDLANSKSK